MSDPKVPVVQEEPTTGTGNSNDDIFSITKSNKNINITSMDDDDIFKSAIESPVTESEMTTTTTKPFHGEDEIDLNDDEDEDDDDEASLVKPTTEISLEDSVEVEIKEDTNKPNKSFSSAPTTKKDNSFKNGDIRPSTSGSDDSTGSGAGTPEKRDQPQPSKTKPYTNSSGDQGQETKSATVSPPQTEISGPKSSTTEPVASALSPTVHSPANEIDGQFLEITVSDPQKQGDGISGYIQFRVTTKTNIALFRKKEFAVWRRFSDFLGLHSKLAEKFLKKGRIVPPAPEKNIMGTTKIKMGGSTGTGGSSGGGESSSNANSPSDFLEKRRAVLERFMNRISAHPVLRVDPDFRDFLEIDSDLPKSTSTSALSGAGFVRLVSRVGETVNKIAYKMDESDPWFEEKIQNIEALETQLRKVHGSVELLVLNRKELAHSTGAFAKSAAILSHAEEHTSLARALAQLADVEEKVEQLHNEQANSDFYLFCELLKDYITLIGSVKEVFHERVKTYQLWQHSQQTLNKKREIKARLELQVRNDKIPQAREEVVEWEGKVERSQEDFNNISAVIKKEMEQFEINRVKEFKKIIVKYLESLLRHQQELAQYWETFLPEAKAIS